MPFFRFVPAALLVLAVAPATAANLITNPNFSTDITGWTANSSGTSLGFDPSVDVNAAANSGALWMSTSNGSNSNLAALQCIAQPLGTEFSFGVKILPGTADIYGMTCEAYASTDCSGAALDEASAEASAPDSNGWIPLASSAPFPLPASTGSVLCSITAEQPLRPARPAAPQGYAIAIRADDAYFAPGTTPVSLQSFSVD